MKKIYFAVFALSSVILKAQWNISPAINNSVCIQANEQINPKTIPDLKGGTIIVWEDYRNDATKTTADIYAQRIDANGNALWAANGIVICGDASDQNAPTAVTDSLGGAYIVWQDYRGLKRNLYAQHIDSSGNVLWTSNGIAVAARNYDQKNPKVLNDGNKGLIVFWQDSVGGAYDIYGQRLNSAGTAQWGTALGICTNALSQVNPKAQITSAGDIYVTWQDKRNGSDYDIYMQKINISGSPQWTANGIVLCNIAGTQANPKISLDGSGYPIVLWQDKRNGLDYDLYAQRVNASGTIQWSNNGQAVCTKTGSQSGGDLTANGINNGVIFTWKDERNGANNTDVYAQMFNLSGASQWASGGIAVTSAAANQLAPNIISDGNGGAIISYQDSSSGSWNIKAQRLNGSGTLLWANGGVDIGSSSGNQINQSNILTSNGSSIYCFQDTRSGDSDIYAYKVDVNGNAIITGMKKMTNNDFINVFPNPANEYFTFAIAENIKWTITITDIKGQVVFQQQPSNSTFTYHSTLDNGVYFYTIETSDKIGAGKLIIVK